LGYAEVKLIDLPHDVNEVVFVGRGFLIQLVFVETQHGQHEFVDVLIGNVERI